MILFKIEEIPDLYKRAGVTKKEFAAHFGVSTNTVRAWLKGDRSNAMKEKHRAKGVELRNQLKEAGQ